MATRKSNWSNATSCDTDSVEKLLDLAKARTKLHANISPSNYSWVATSSGRNGLSFMYAVTKHANTVELVIDRGKDSDDENRSIFEQFKAHQAEIESTFGAPLDWYSQEDVRLCRIRFGQAGGYRNEEEKWPEIQNRMVDAMIRLEKSLRPFFQNLQLP